MRGAYDRTSNGQGNSATSLIGNGSLDVGQPSLF
jgi:hypothetical protein